MILPVAGAVCSKFSRSQLGISTNQVDSGQSSLCYCGTHVVNGRR